MMMISQRQTLVCSYSRTLVRTARRKRHMPHTHTRSLIQWIKSKGQQSTTQKGCNVFSPLSIQNSTHTAVHCTAAAAVQ